MIFNTGSGEYDMNQNNTWFLEYPNDILDGIYHDVDEENFIYISKHVGGFHMVADDLAQEGVDLCRYEADEIDFTEPPHCYVVKSIMRLIFNEALIIVEEHNEE